MKQLTIDPKTYFDSFFFIKISMRVFSSDKWELQGHFDMTGLMIKGRCSALYEVRLYNSSFVTPD